MTFAVAWVAYPLVLLALCAGLGLLVDAASGRRLPGALVVPVASPPGLPPRPCRPRRRGRGGSLDRQLPACRRRRRRHDALALRPPGRMGDLRRPCRLCPLRRSSRLLRRPHLHHLRRRNGDRRLARNRRFRPGRGDLAARRGPAPARRRACLAPAVLPRFPARDAGPDRLAARRAHRVAFPTVPSRGRLSRRRSDRRLWLCRLGWTAAVGGAGRARLRARRGAPPGSARDRPRCRPPRSRPLLAAGIECRGLVGDRGTGRAHRRRARDLRLGRRRRLDRSLRPLGGGSDRQRDRRFGSRHARPLRRPLRAARNQRSLRRRRPGAALRRQPLRGLLPPRSRARRAPPVRPRSRPVQTTARVSAADRPSLAGPEPPAAAVRTAVPGGGLRSLAAAPDRELPPALPHGSRPAGSARRPARLLADGRPRSARAGQPARRGAGGNPPRRRRAAARARARSGGRRRAGDARDLCRRRWDWIEAVTRR